MPLSATAQDSVFPFICEELYLTGQWQSVQLTKG